MPQSPKWAYQLRYYICFRTRWRREEFGKANREASLSRLLAEVCGNHEFHLLQHKVYPDHVRCLLSLKPHHSVFVVINKLKSNISREFCSETGLEPPLWATGYLVSDARAHSGGEAIPGSSGASRL